MQFIKNNKLFIFLAITATAAFLAAQTGGFKIFKSESGNKWSPTGNYGSVHHK